MKLIIFLFSFVFIANIQVVFAQNEMVRCSYTMVSSQYSCVLTIYNPNGLNNFEYINGTHMPEKTAYDVLRIDRVEGSNTSNVPSILCDKMRNVQYIEMNQIGIKTIDEDSFKGCRKLLGLHLFSNKITEIHENAFSQNLDLDYLYLNNNQLTTVPENLFVNQQKLSVLYLYYNQIQDLPKNVFQSLINLKELALLENKISTLKVEWFETLANLQILWLESNQIEELPMNVFSPLKNLTELYLYNNKLRVIHSDSFSVHPKLAQVYMSNNQIDAIDEKFINNTAVTRFDLRSNTCVNKDIADNSPSRESMRNDLRHCFENYQELITQTTTIAPTTTVSTTSAQPPTTTTSLTLPPGCIGGNLDERVCSLEDENEQLWADNQRLSLVTEDLQRQINKLTGENHQQKEHQDKEINELKKVVNVFADAIEKLQKQVIELTTRP